MDSLKISKTKSIVHFKGGVAVTGLSKYLKAAEGRS